MYFSSMFEHFKTQAYCISHVNKFHFLPAFLLRLEESHLACTSAYKSDIHTASHNCSTPSDVEWNFT